MNLNYGIGRLDGTAGCYDHRTLEPDLMSLHIPGQPDLAVNGVS